MQSDKGEYRSIYDTSVEMFNIARKDYDINLYDKILELRKFEIENFWKRAIFFWGTIALLYLGYFRIDSESLQYALVALIGLLFNIIFSFSIRGSKYWQEHYEDLASQYEISLNFILFRHTQTQSFLKKSFALSKPHRFSVSKLVMLLADLSVIVWFFLWVKTITDIFPTLELNFSLRGSFHFQTFFVIGSQALIIAYFLYFLSKGQVYYKPTSYKISNYAEVDGRLRYGENKGTKETLL